MSERNWIYSLYREFGSVDGPGIRFVTFNDTGYNRIL